MSDVVVFTEEASARIVGECLIEKLGLAERFMFLEHQGWGHLEKSFPRKINAWMSPTPPRFIVMRDNDGGDCVQTKARLLGMVPAKAKARVKIRLVMQQLESWYLGDLDSLVGAGLLSKAKAQSHKGKASLRNPDAIRHAKASFKKFVTDGGQIELARQIGPHLSLTGNRSRSFQVFVDSLRWAATEENAPPC